MAQFTIRDEETGEERVVEYDPAEHPAFHRVMTGESDLTQSVSRPRRLRPETPLTPEQSAERVAKTRSVLKEWNGFDPTPEEEAELDAELDRRFIAAGLDPLPRHDG